MTLNEAIDKQTNFRQQNICARVQRPATLTELSAFWKLGAWSPHQVTSTALATPDASAKLRRTTKNAILSGVSSARHASVRPPEPLFTAACCGGGGECAGVDGDATAAGGEVGGEAIAAGDGEAGVGEATLPAGSGVAAGVAGAEGDAGVAGVVAAAGVLGVAGVAGVAGAGAGDAGGAGEVGPAAATAAGAGEAGVDAAAAACTAMTPPSPPRYNSCTVQLDASDGSYPNNNQLIWRCLVSRNSLKAAFRSGSSLSLTAELAPPNCFLALMSLCTAASLASVSAWPLLPEILARNASTITKQQRCEE
jgi:hypothetical protein